METPINEQSQQFYSFWKTAVSNQVSLLESFYQELGKHQGEAISRAGTTLDEATRLTKDSVNQAQQLVGQWRKLLLENARKAADYIDPPKA